MNKCIDTRFGKSSHNSSFFFSCFSNNISWKLLFSAEKLKREFDKSFGAPWNVVVGEAFSFNVDYDFHFLYYFLYGPVAILAWRVSPTKNVFGAKFQIIFFSVEVSYLVKSITSPNEKWSPKEIPKWCERNAKSLIVFKRNQNLWKSCNLPWHFPSAVKINVPHFKQCRKSIRQTQCTFHWTIYFVDLPPSKISFTPIVLGVGNTFLVESTQKFPALQMS